MICESIAKMHTQKEKRKRNIQLGKREQIGAYQNLGVKTPSTSACGVRCDQWHEGAIYPRYLVKIAGFGPHQMLGVGGAILGTDNKPKRQVKRGLLGFKF